MADPSGSIPYVVINLISVFEMEKRDLKNIIRIIGWSIVLIVIWIIDYYKNW